MPSPTLIVTSLALVIETLLSITSARTSLDSVKLQDSEILAILSEPPSKPSVIAAGTNPLSVSYDKSENGAEATLRSRATMR